MADKIVSHVVAAKVVSGGLGVRIGLSEQELAIVKAVLATAAHGWRAFECETLDDDGTYVGTVRLTTHPTVAAAPASAAGVVMLDPGVEEAAPAAALRRKRPPATPAQARIRAALARGKSDCEPQNSVLEPLENPPPSADSDVTSMG